MTIGQLIKPPSIASPVLASTANAAKKAKGNKVTGNVTAPVSAQAQMQCYGKIWRMTHEKLDECVYHLLLTEPQPLVVICAEDAVSSLVATMKNLFSPHENGSHSMQITPVTLKSQRAAVVKTMRKNVTRDRGLIITAQECAMLTRGCLPQGIHCKTLVHVGVVPSVGELSRRAEMSLPSLSAEEVNHVYLVDKTAASSMSASPSGTSMIACIPTYPTHRNWMPALQARCSAARKLAVAMQSGSALWGSNGQSDKDARRAGLTGSDDVFVKPSGHTRDGEGNAGGDIGQLQDALAGRLEGLRAKLKLTMGIPLPGLAPVAVAAHNSTFGVDNIDDNGKAFSPSSISAVPVSASAAVSQGSSESLKSRRAKMELLGMIHTSSAEEKLVQSRTGRTLAATQWIDGFAGCDVCSDCLDAPLAWKTVRLGASMDAAAKNVRPIVEGFRGFVLQRSQRKMPKRHQETEEFFLALPKATQESLRSGRITALGWRPSPFGDGEWGGRFGKCCAHNEVAMFYLRPFAPLQVLNTHICSKASPAPGNEGFDGCLEFLMAQSRFFGRAMSVWDDRYFHYIDATGAHSAMEKSALLNHSEARVQSTINNLREWTVFNQGVHPAHSMINAIELVAQIGSGLVIVPFLEGRSAGSSGGSRHILRTIASFALSGNLKFLLTNETRK